jgi:hypothetical protein
MTRSKTLLALLLSALPASAGTWIVDDNGGPGVDFTDIAPAIAAASPGDALWVLPGDYSGFVLDKPLALVAPGGATVAWGTNDCKILGLSPGTTATLSGFTFLPETSLLVQNCSGTVVIDRLTLLKGGIGVDGSSDVRLRASRVEEGLYVQSSRVEASECTILRGPPLYSLCPGANGFEAVGVGPGSRAHLYRSSVKGGKGGNPNDPFNCIGGDGGTGIEVTDGQLLLAGDPLHTVKGGDGGSGMYSGLPGYPLLTFGSAHTRVSGVSSPAGGWPSGTSEVPVPRDPTLFILDQVGAGEALTLRVQTEPGVTVELMLGRMPALGAQVGSAEVLMLVPLRTFQLGAAAGNGVAGLNFLTPDHLTPGFTYFAQGRVTFPGGEQRYTNSVPIVVQ